MKIYLVIQSMTSRDLLIPRHQVPASATFDAQWSSKCCNLSVPPFSWEFPRSKYSFFFFCASFKRHPLSRLFGTFLTSSTRTVPQRQVIVTIGIPEHCETKLMGLSAVNFLPIFSALWCLVLLGFLFFFNLIPRWFLLPFYPEFFYVSVFLCMIFYLNFVCFQAARIFLSPLR